MYRAPTYTTRQLASLLRQLKRGRKTNVLIFDGLDPKRLSVNTARAEFRWSKRYVEWLARDLR